MRVLVTGINGFVGHHVARQLHASKHEVIGVGQQDQVPSDLGRIVSGYYRADLTDPKQVSAINLAAVDAVINLAGIAKVGGAAGQMELYERVNVGVHTVLYEECLKQGVTPRIVAVSTGAVYDSDQPMPLTEDSELVDEDKTNEYVISKQRMEQAVLKFKDRGLSPVIARPFNHTGPGQLPGFLLPDLADQLEAARQQGTPVLTGNLETKRDFTDVRDVANAYILLATAPLENLKYDIYNICSGQSVAGREILGLLAQAYGYDDIKTEVDTARLRQHEVMDIYGSSSRLQQDTGWTPRYSLQQTIEDFVAWKKTNS